MDELSRSRGSEGYGACADEGASNAIAILRGGAAKWMSFRALRGSEGYGACADEGASIAFG